MRRVPIPGGPSAVSGRMQPSTSDPALHYGERGLSGLGNEYEPVSGSSSEDISEDELATVTVMRERGAVYEQRRDAGSSGRPRRRR